ncbi:hypothetical protein MAMC_00607 [Methylacidimicrobium cyclopophantes]|uniref:Uncharacterized protein n=1 Tax=Methylacidimicrobium cyclopophantes TaxID=1041766 RepID=A0A5E6MHI8_9BACT|nr:hypothetical protein [Methylacidimicrobium cyclopophantes]VVM05475.1 hypothetical protein MAMC_00607 [Methylacidimicrobium cyclopophantes]
MKHKFVAFIGAMLLWVSSVSGFAAVSPKEHAGDPLDRGVESLNLAADRVGRWFYCRARQWNHEITPFCLAIAIGIAAWRIARKQSIAESAANVALYLLLSLLLFLKAPETLFHPSKGLLSHAARITCVRIARLSPEGAQGTNIRQWWRNWLGPWNDPDKSKLSPIYARERVLGFPEGGSSARRFLVNQTRQALVAATHRDILPGKKLESAIYSLLLLSERKFLKLLLLLCLMLLGIGFFLFSALHLLSCGGSSLLWELTMAAGLVALPVLLLSPAPRILRIWLQIFFAASLLPILWHFVSATSYLALTTLYSSVFGEKGLFEELRETGAEMLKGLIGKKALLLTFWSLVPERPGSILLGLYEIVAELIGFCTVAVSVCSTLFLGALLPLMSLWWALRRKPEAADSLIAGWCRLHREIALVATALGSCLAAWSAGLDREGFIPAVAPDASMANAFAGSAKALPAIPGQGKEGFKEGPNPPLS